VGNAGAPTVISSDARPHLAPKARLRLDRKTNRYMLLYPERGMQLNATAADIVQLCTGEHTVADIIERLAQKYAPQPRAVIEEAVRSFLDALSERALLQHEERGGEPAPPDVKAP
jgi:pyrroloquinoline quinone biosynthesis protein D